MLSGKAWQLTGEIEAQKRPENSLLEEYLQFDRTTRLRKWIDENVRLKKRFDFCLAPTITTETTDSIEELIKQRIRDKVFDDVERKKRTTPAQEMSAYKKEIVLDHEKSQLSLAQVYEQEFVKKQNVKRIFNCEENVSQTFYRPKKRRRKTNDTKSFERWCRIYLSILTLCQISVSRRDR